MAFTLITNNDIFRQLKSEFYANVTAGLAAAELEREEATAIKTVVDKLRHRYDLTDPLADKDERLVGWVVCIYLYKLHRRQNPRSVPTDLASDCDATIKWLNDIRDGKEHPDFPGLLDEDGAEDKGSNDLRTGYRPTTQSGDFFLPQ